MVAGHVQNDSPLARITRDDPTDAWLRSWQQHHAGDPPVAPFVSNLVFVDESGDKAREMSATYTSNQFKHAVEHYEITSSHHGTIKGYESYSSLRMSPEEAKIAIENAHASSIAGTPQEVLEQLDKVRRQRDPQGMYPHLYTGGMSHEECIRSMQLFAKKCLNEMKSWPGAPLTIGDIS